MAGHWRSQLAAITRQLLPTQPSSPLASTSRSEGSIAHFQARRTQCPPPALWVPKSSSTPSAWTVVVEYLWARMASVALSFLYVAFVRILQLLRLRREDRDELGIEVIMLRHEVLVLLRQIVRPALEPAE